ncbi:MAG: hypothetical protein HY961_21090 [Ignavibacteriae bacterium]|nr:hypothetical protein [Ignavibacteriota bacterium]
MQTASVSTTFPDIERLDDGEQQAILLARELNLPLLIEETVGRRVATALGISVSGIAGQVVKAYKERIIGTSEAQFLLKRLLDAGRINKKIYDALHSVIR